MTPPSDDSAAAQTELPSAAMVAAYLMANPDFLCDNPDVLHELDIHHAADGTASLLERQVASLREDNRRLKARFTELVGLAQSNQGLINRIHQLALALMEAAGPRAIFATLAESVSREFHAERVRTLIFADPGFAESPVLSEFVGAQCAERRLFSAVLADRTARLGKLVAEQSAYLFPESGNDGSAVVLPLSGRSWDGLLIISSDDGARFNDDMGTEFLSYLGDVVSLIIDPWVARGAPA